MEAQRNSGVRIEPLVWSKPQQNKPQKSTGDLGGSSTVASSIAGRFTVASFDGDKTFHVMGTGTPGRYGSMEEAKAAVQSCYDRRIRSCIIEGAGAREALKPFAEVWMEIERDQYPDTYHVIDVRDRYFLTAGDFRRAALASRDGTADIPQDVVRLVVASRNVAYGGTPAPQDIQELDKAAEAFAGRVPWDDDPTTLDDESN